MYYGLGEKKNFYDLKLDIITENIYGVDILTGAIEIAKLRLWLWLISDFEESKNEIKALPNIEYNLKVGNSLIGWLDEKLEQMPINTPLTEKVDGIFTGLIAFSENGDAEDLKKAREMLKRYKLDDYIEAYYILYKIYRRAHGLKAQNLRSILETIRESIYSVVTPTFLDYVNCKIAGIEPNKPLKEQSAKYKSMKKKAITKEEFDKLQVFHWKIDFGHIIKQGGFDVVIGNPPYYNIGSKDLLKITDEYKYLSNGVVNISSIFVLHSMKLLSKQRKLGFIIPKSFLIVDSWSKLRNYLLSEKKLTSVNDVSKAFSDVGLEQVIILVDNCKANHKFCIEIFNNDVLINRIPKDFFQKIGLILTHIDNEKLHIIKKIDRDAIKLGNIAEMPRGITLKSSEYISHPDPNTVRILGGTSISKYLIKEGNKRKPSRYLKRNHPLIKKKIDIFNRPRIIYQNVVSSVPKIVATIDTNKFPTDDTLNNLLLHKKDFDNKYVLSILNSKLMVFYLKYAIINCSILTVHLDKPYLGRVPIIKASKDQQKPFINLVDKILSITKSKDYPENKEKRAKVKELQDKIDKMVYKLYGLTEEEIKIVEGNVND